MWRMTPRLATATLTATLALTFSTAPGVEAATMQAAASVQTYSYSTSGSISGPSYDVPISFTPESGGGMLTTPGSVVLGQFTTGLLPSTATVTYNNTPFTIDLNVSAVNSSNGYYYPPYYGYNPNVYTYVISGVLNGSFSGDGTSNMMAMITGITGSGTGQATSPPFPISDLQVNLPQGIAGPNGFTQGVTTITAQVLVAGIGLPSPAPEPSTIAVFGLALAGWACHRRRRARA
jgi:PEP-CTERM motif